MSLPEAIAERPGALLYLAAQAAQELANTKLATLGINVRQFGILTMLSTTGPVSQLAIGDNVRIDRTTMVAMIDDLERHGLVHRERNPDDRRAYLVSLTPTGKRRQQQAAAALTGGADEFFAPLTLPEREQLLDFLRRLVAAHR